MGRGDDMDKNLNLNEVNPFILFCRSPRIHNTLPPDTVHPRRKVKWYELEFQTAGEGYAITDDIKLPAGKGHMLFRKPGMIVQSFYPYSCYFLIFDAFHDPFKIYDFELLDADKGGYTDHEIGYGDKADYSLDFPPLLMVHRYYEFENLFVKCYNAYTSNDMFAIFNQKKYLIDILFLLQKEISDEAHVKSRNRSFGTNYSKVINLKNHIDSRISSRFSLNDLAEVAGLSPNFLSKIFKSITGESPIDYINRSKLALAKKLLLETNLVIKQIAAQCGFENETYFYILFKKSEGVSPSEYRNRNMQFL